MKMLCSKFVFAASLFSIGSLAHGQATRTWVSGVGDDANPCSRTAPCKTFAGAISKTAPSGEIDNLDSGGFGAVTITKSITIDGSGGGIAGVLVSGTNGIVINAPAGTVVTLRNLILEGIGSGLNGISFVGGGVLHIEHCRIYGFTLHGINVNLATGGEVYIDDTTSEDNTQNGLNIFGSASGAAGEIHVNITNSHFSNNLNGVYASDSSRVAVRASEADGNSAAGFQAFANTNSSTMSIFNSTAANNLGAGVGAGGGTAAATIRAANVALFSNTAGWETGSNGSIQSFGNNYNPGSGTPTSTITPQ